MRNGDGHILCSVSWHMAISGAVIAHQRLVDVPLHGYTLLTCSSACHLQSRSHCSISQITSRSLQLRHMLPYASGTSSRYSRTNILTTSRILRLSPLSQGQSTSHGSIWCRLQSKLEQHLSFRLCSLLSRLPGLTIAL